MRKFRRARTKNARRENDLADLSRKNRLGIDRKELRSSSGFAIGWTPLPGRVNTVRLRRASVGSADLLISREAQLERRPLRSLRRDRSRVARVRLTLGHISKRTNWKHTPTLLARPPPLSPRILDWASFPSQMLDQTFVSPSRQGQSPSRPDRGKEGGELPYLIDIPCEMRWKRANAGDISAFEIVASHIRSD